MCGEPLVERLRRVAPARPDFVVLREPDLDDAEYAGLFAGCRDVLAPYGIPLTAHSHPRVADGWMWLPFSKCHMYDKHKFVSVHSAEEAEQVVGADYVVAGNIFETPCKPGAPARGLEFLRGIVRTVPRPVLAIGGITPENARSCAAAGAAGVCVMTSVMTNPDPAGLVMRVKEVLK